MQIDILTLFPEMFSNVFDASLIGRAQKNKLVQINIHNLREFSEDKHKKVDDKPYGGGPGMVIKVEPVYRALKYLTKKEKGTTKSTCIIYLSPQGEIFSQELALKLSKYKHLILLCGRYEGIDERIMKFVDKEISIGNYVLTGGEIPAMVVVDATVRLIDGVVKKKDSIMQDSFFTGDGGLQGKLLDYPQYTRPRIFKNMKVPDVLLSGNHKKIQEWRAKQSIKNTYLKRPDLLSFCTVKSGAPTRSVGRAKKSRYYENQFILTKHSLVFGFKFF
ncbi:MAG: tRNA (guanosine(37)-N1)-methyltransferase TrmD [Elusimicrobiota bacterium]|nr:tRNA (guanosine(37)-N1)-methyltransferase TrmD [Elusimicrobiota bacterium]